MLERLKLDTLPEPLGLRSGPDALGGVGAEGGDLGCALQSYSGCSAMQGACEQECHGERDSHKLARRSEGYEEVQSLGWIWEHVMMD